MQQYAPHLGHATIIQACEEPGCPVCFLVKKSVNMYLAMVLAGYVDAPDLRQQLCDSWGYCHKHAWELSKVEHGNILTISIMYQDILEREAHKALEQLSGKKAGKTSGGFLQGFFKGKKPEAPSQQHPYQTVCPACEMGREVEENALRILLKALAEKDTSIQDALHSSDGLCFPHLHRALAMASEQHVIEFLVTFSKETLAGIQAGLNELIRKNDYRFQHEPVGEEKDSWKRAISLIVGSE